MQAPAEQKTNSGLILRAKKFFKHPLTVAGALLVARFGFDLYAQHKLDCIKAQKNR